MKSRRMKKNKRVSRKRNTKRRGRRYHGGAGFDGKEPYKKEATSIKEGISRTYPSIFGIPPEATRKISDGLLEDEIHMLQKSNAINSKILRQVKLSPEESLQYITDEGFAESVHQRYTPNLVPQYNICLSFKYMDFSVDDAIQMRALPSCKQINFYECKFPQNNNPINAKGQYTALLSANAELLSDNVIKDVTSVTLTKCNLVDCYFLSNIKKEVTMHECEIATDGIEWLINVPIVRVIDSKLKMFGGNKFNNNFNTHHYYKTKTQYLDLSYTKSIINNGTTYGQLQIHNFNNLNTLILDHTKSSCPFLFAEIMNSLRVLRVVDCNINPTRLEIQYPHVVIISEEHEENEM